MACLRRKLLGVWIALAAPALQAIAHPSGFGAAMDHAMATMFAGMQTVPAGDPDRDFAETMIPHHQGAIAMAVAELRYGRNLQLKRIAQEISQAAIFDVDDRVSASTDRGSPFAPVGLVSRDSILRQSYATGTLSRTHFPAPV
jgi:hypothetical protein